MFASRYSALRALSIVVAASLAWVMPALAFLGYNQTFHTDAELYLRIGMAIICVVWMVVCMQDLDGPLAGLATFFFVLWSIIAALFLLFGAFFALMTIFGILRGY
ncbi:hypothetical protein [Celeribacter sp.]|uniref:hypothetical protein n=1 Tax=Celeribacter sp. TaxID=1890673 RepID=UPI003A94B6AE